MNKNDYSSMDKLIDLGMGISIAKQMTNTLNSAIENMKIPGSSMPQKGNEIQSSFYIEIEGKAAGPFSDAEIKKLFNDKIITKDSLVWKQGMSSWEKIQNVPEALRLFVLSSTKQEKTV